MKQLLIRADDIGYSYAVNVGIARAVNEGLVRSAGLMPNMPEAQRGWDWVKDAGIAIGQHTNLCLGTPCADPALIPSLVDENGQLHSSREYRAAFKEGREFAAYDELVIEVECGDEQEPQPGNPRRGGEVRFQGAGRQLRSHEDRALRLHRRAHGARGHASP